MSRIRLNQRRCRERKLAYITSLEDRLHAYEKEASSAGRQLQERARTLATENTKMRRVIMQAFGIGDCEFEDLDAETMISKIRCRGHAQPYPSPVHSERSHETVSEDRQISAPSTTGMRLNSFFKKSRISLSRWVRI